MSSGRQDGRQEDKTLMEDKMVIPPQSRATVMASLHRGHAGLFKMKDVSISYFWWPLLNRQISLTAANCKKCIKFGKNLKAVIPSTEIALTESTEDPNQEF